MYFKVFKNNALIFLSFEANLLTASCDNMDETITSDNKVDVPLITQKMLHFMYRDKKFSINEFIRQLTDIFRFIP